LKRLFIKRTDNACVLISPNEKKQTKGTASKNENKERMAENSSASTLKRDFFSAMAAAAEKAADTSARIQPVHKTCFRVIPLQI
jgi:hypothetical protein